MINLSDIAHQIMIEKGFIPEFPSVVMAEAKSLHPPPLAKRDLRHLQFVSIDNEDSLDLDQLTYAEGDKIYVAVADVEQLVKKNSVLDQFAGHNTTSVYTPTKVFPMLPPELSNDLTSLNENADRNSVVIEIQVKEDGQFNLIDVYSASVRNHSKLAYTQVSNWLEEKTPFPPELKEQLQLQDRLAQQIEKYRAKEGALSFDRMELEPIVQNGIPIGLKERELPGRANQLIENFMIAANFAVTRYLMAHGLPTLRRTVEPPKRWDRIVDLANEYGEKLPKEPDSKALRSFLLKQQMKDPMRFSILSLAVIKLIGRAEYRVTYPGEQAVGHFDLALRDYAHATAPNRRYSDLIIQRLIKGEKYSREELVSIAEWCTQKEVDAQKVERQMAKSTAAMILKDRIGEKFRALVVGVNEDGTWIRLLNPPIEGKLIHGYDGLDVGNVINVKLIDTDIIKGYIDFRRF